jgi:hypothetical protein
MAVTIIPNVTNWTVTPQNGQVGYFTLMNTWLGQSTAVIASLQTAIAAQNTANSEINALAIQVANDTDTTVAAKNEAVTALAILSSGTINDTTLGTNKAYSNQKTNDLLALKIDKDINSLTAKTTPNDADNFVTSDSSTAHVLKKLTWANIKNFQCLEKFKSIKRLETHYCVKLETDKGLSKFNDTLEFLHINQSKKFIFSDELLQLKRLKVLCLNACAPIESLEFLKHFPKLIDFRFVNTNILDGNLNPLLDHPTLRTVGFLDKKHYNFKSDKLKLEIDKKFDNEYKTKVYKGEYMTYRYDYD